MDDKAEMDVESLAVEGFGFDLFFIAASLSTFACSRRRALDLNIYVACPCLYRHTSLTPRIGRQTRTVRYNFHVSGEFVPQPVGFSMLQCYAAICVFRDLLFPSLSSSKRRLTVGPLQLHPSDFGKIG